MPRPGAPKRPLRLPVSSSQGGANPKNSKPSGAPEGLME
jgi:hypothetical protein